MASAWPTCSPERAPAESWRDSSFRAAAILEDPATGSATANFGGWCLAMGRPLPLALEISQGEFVGRPSDAVSRGDRRPPIRVGGDVIELGAGSITLD